MSANEQHRVSAFFLNFPLGLLVGCVVTLLLVWSLDANLHPKIEEAVVSLFGAAAGLTSAGLALAGLLYNISNQNLIVERNRLRDLAAWRATLPIVLSRLIDIARSGMRASVRLGDAASWSQDELNRRLELPATMTETLRNCIKSSDTASAEWLAVLAARYQVYMSRSADLISNPTRPNADTALDWATFHALVEHCFPFGRGATQEVGSALDSQRIYSAFWINDIEIESYPLLPAILRTRTGRYGMADVSKFQFRLDIA